MWGLMKSKKKVRALSIVLLPGTSNTHMHTPYTYTHACIHMSTATHMYTHGHVAFMYTYTHMYACV